MGADEFGIGGNARPAARNFPRFRVDIFEADGFHFFHAPGDRRGGFGRAGDAGANVVAEFLEIFVGVGFHRAAPATAASAFSVPSSMVKATLALRCPELRWRDGAKTKRGQRDAHQAREFSNHAKNSFRVMCELQFARE